MYILDKTLREYTVDTVKKKDVFKIKAFNLNNARCIGRMECWKQGKKYIRILPVRNKKIA